VYTAAKYQSRLVVDTGANNVVCIEMRKQM